MVGFKGNDSTIGRDKKIEIYSWREFRFRRLIMVIAFLVGFTLILVSSGFVFKYVVQVTGLSLALTGLFYFVNVSCPKCKKKFFSQEECLKPLRKRSCRYCGIKYKE